MEHPLHRFTRAIAAGAATGLIGATLLIGGSPASAITTPVDITVDLTFSGEIRPFAVSGVVPGPGVELTEDDELPSEANLCGAVEVDIDPDADTITLIAANGTCLYDVAVITITTTEDFSALTLLGDDTLFLDGPEPTIELTATGATITYDGGEASFSTNDDGEVPGTAVFSYAVAAPEPEAALTPAAVQAGDPVTVSGTGCTNSPVLVTVSPEGGDPIVTEDEVLGDADGDWAYEVDTTDLTPGAYVVESRCVLADGQGFDYEVLGFTVTADAPPATPAPAAPTFTG